MRIADMPAVERPREKLIARGPTMLADHELLAILLRTGTKGKSALEIAKGLLVQHKLDKLFKLDMVTLKAVPGVDSGKACSLLAAFELAHRALGLRDETLPIVDSAQSALPHLRDIVDRKKEHLVALYLDGRNQLLHREVVSVGTLTVSVIHPREVFEPAVRLGAAAVLVAHNHPSGDLFPSAADIEATRRLAQAGKIMGIALVDHLIVTKGDWQSLRAMGLLKSTDD